MSEEFDEQRPWTPDETRRFIEREEYKARYFGWMVRAMGVGLVFMVALILAVSFFA